jgi:hypothetical protein
MSLQIHISRRKRIEGLNNLLNSFLTSAWKRLHKESQHCLAVRSYLWLLFAQTSLDWIVSSLALGNGQGGSFTKKAIQCFALLWHPEINYRPQTISAWIVSSLALGNGRKGGLTKKAIQCFALLWHPEINYKPQTISA